MLPGLTRILTCPHCAAPHRRETYRSVNSIGARYWSDGYLQARLWPRPPKIARCGSCGRLFWLEEAQQIGELEDLDSRAMLEIGGEELPPPAPRPPEWENAPEISNYPSAKEFVEALQVFADAGPERLRHLRMALWHEHNDVKRDPRWSWPRECEEHFAPNLEALIQMFDESAPCDRLLKAEALRELGRFEPAVEMLAAPFEERLQVAADQIRQRALIGDAEVFRLEEPDSSRFRASLEVKFTLH